MTQAACPNCGEPVDRRQLVCLECGARIALREPSSWAREPVTAVAAALLAVVVIGAGLFGFAIAELTGDDGGATRGERAGRDAPAVVSGDEQPTRTATTQTETTAADEPAPPDRVPGWPAGLGAHTVVLLSSGERAAALEVAKEARAGGLEAGLIRSDDYDLGTGLWIVYAGRFTTPEGAQLQATQLGERYPGAYPQFVQRSQ